jgi:predicted flap endonuclease-1-like 5' DNA nuclease
MMSTPLVLLALAVALIGGFLLGRARAPGRRRADDLDAAPAAPSIAPSTAPPTAPSTAPLITASSQPADSAAVPAIAPVVPAANVPAAGPDGAPSDAAVGAGSAGIDAERARLLCAMEAETAALRRTLASGEAAIRQLRELDADRRRTYDDLARARGETARYRQLVIDLENNAPPPLLDGPGSPDDLKLIVGVGPVLERMLQQLGITTYRQIARWTERDIDEFDARLHEFPGRIRRDAWVVQARALHQSKFGEVLPLRERS